MAKVENRFMEYKGNRIPVKVFREFRKNVRASIGRRAAILRMPVLLLPKDQKRYLDWFQEWLEDQFSKNEELLSRIAGRSYKDGDLLEVGERTYKISINYEDRKTHNGRLQSGIIHLRLCADTDIPDQQKAMRHLLSRVIGADFLPEVTRRVHELNAIHFKKEIKAIRLKYNRSNWGSCSAKGNINLSTRLLFTPTEVMDYVIIHELAHLTELNHSRAFWELVKNAMPDYKKKEMWLKQNGHKCMF